MNSRKLTIISSLISGALAVALAVGALRQPNVTYASTLAAMSPNGATGIQVQNLETSAASTIQMRLYPQDSAAAPTVLQRANVAAESAANFYLPSETAVGQGSYAAVLESDRQIAAIARTEWLDAGKRGAATYASVAPAQNVILPLVLGATPAAPGGYASQVSEFTIQNATTGTGTAQVTVSIFATGQASAVKTLTRSIAAGASTTVRMSEFTDLPDTQSPPDPKGFVGYARIEASAPATPLVVQSFVDFTNSNTAVYGFSGVPASEASTTLYAPLLRRDYYGTTGVSLVNLNAAPASVSITYYNDPGSPQQLAGAGPHETVTIPAQSSVVVWQGPRAGNPLPDDATGANNNGWYGSAKFVSAGGNILAVVNDAVYDNNFNTLTSAAYNAATASDGATKVFAPLVRRRHVQGQELTTGIQVQNLGTAPAQITVRYNRQNDDGSSTAVGSETKTAGPGASVNFYQDAPTTPFPAASYGSAVIESAGQPIALIVNDASVSGTLDAAIYNGLK